MSEVKVNKISPRSGTALTVGDGGDTVTVTGNDIRSDAYKASDGGNIVSQSGTTITLGASGDTVEIASGATLIGGGISWQSSIVTAATLNAVAGNGYWIDTTSNACTITLPGSASVGDQIIFTDYARKWGTNAVTINQNSLKFQGYTSPNPIYNTDGQSVDIVYSGTTQGWIPNSDDDVTFETSQAYDVEYLLVAGGGSGGSGDGAGAGAGGHLTNFSGTAVGMEPGVTYTITVGGGGAAVGSPGVKVTGNPGNDSTITGTGFSTLTAVAGGGGGASIGAPGYDGLDGGSGGGGGNSGGTGGSGTVGQGNDGGDNGAGGGGAGAVGTQPNGGDGLANSITGASVTRAGGGGRFVAPGGPSGSGGSGGGTSGSSSPSARSSAAAANTGGGSGGGDNGGSGTGGSGVVILRMATSDYSGTTSGSPTVTTDGSDTIITFNANGTYTA